MIRNCVQLIRPRRWTKNTLVFAALLFSGQWTAASNIFFTCIVFVSFSSVASSLYVLNDWLDREKDRKHPGKKDRPIASGDIGGTGAILIGLALLLIGGLVLFALPFRSALMVALVIGFYAVLMLSYNFALKEIPVLDMIVIAIGLLLRALAGAVAIDVPVTSWFILTILFLSLLLIAGKRRHELLTLKSSEAGDHRKVLETYEEKFLDQIIALMAGASLVTYSLYTLEGQSPINSGRVGLPLSVILVIFALLRYLLLVYSEGSDEQPEKIFLNDAPLLMCVTLWAAYILALYFV